MSYLKQALTNKDAYKLAIKQSRYHNQLDTKQIESVSEELANLLQAERFEFMPAKQIQYQRFDGAWRPCLQYALKDFLVNKVITNSLTENFEPKCSPNVYSFMPNRSVFKAVTNFCHFLRHHLDEQGKLDIWIVKTDIKNAHQSFPTHKNSLVWEKLDALIYHETEPVEPYINALVHAAIFPLYYTKENNLTQHNAGLPTGNPIANILQNIYLSDLDALAPECADIFYARYGDDLFIAGKNKHIILDWEQRFFNCLKTLELLPNMSKHQHIYFSKNGYRGHDINFQGKNTLYFLKHIITADGFTYLPKNENHMFYARCRKSIIKNHALYQDKSIEEQGKLICQCLAEELLHFDFKTIHTINKLQIAAHTEQNCNILLHVHHSFLKELDRNIAKMIAEQVSGVKGSKAFRVIPYKKIRNDWGLPSLVKLVNKFSRH